MPRYLLHHHHEPNECGVVFAAFSGFESPLRHKGGAGLLPFRRPFDLVDGGLRKRGERARAAALLRRRAHDGRPGQRGADPVTGPGSRNPEGGAMSTSFQQQPGASSRSARTTASPSRSSGSTRPAASRLRSSTPASTSGSSSTCRARTRSPRSTTRSPTRRGRAPPSATPARAASRLAPERSTV